MSRYVFDCETNGFLDKLTTIHSLVLKDVDTGEVFSYAQHECEEGVLQLAMADEIIGHNIIKFDIPAIQKIYPLFSIAEDKVFDTLVASRLMWTNLEEPDWSRIRSGKMKMPPKLAGRHSLEAWGYRLGVWKGDYFKDKEAELKATYLEAYMEAKAENKFAEEHDLPKSVLPLKVPTAEDIGDYAWGLWNQEMQDYCEQDVEANEAFYKLIVKKNYSQDALDLEHQVAHIIAQQERHGFGFNEKAAWELYADLMAERVRLEDELTSLFEPWWVPKGPMKTYKKSMRMKTGEIRLAGSTYQPVKLQVFNPGSRDHIADRLRRVRGWKPMEFTAGGKPQIDETILANLPYPEAKDLGKFFQVKKVLGQLADGPKAWLKYVVKDKIHGSVNTNGAVTGRATHSHPNVAQVPSLGAYRGAECRSLFGPLSDNDVQLGCDVSGLELRMLGHFMARYDSGAYAKEVVEGDVHWVNVQALGIVEDGTERDEHKFVVHKVFRDGTKTFIYGFLYGAGGEKVGSIVFDIALKEEEKGLGSTVRAKIFKGKRKPTNKELKSVGNKLKRDFLKKTPALKKLIEGVKKTAESKGELKGLDGRKLHIRSSHAALNTLLQSAGGLVCKKWIVEFHRLLQEHGLTQYVRQMAWVHDEIQLSVRKEYAERVGDLCVEAIAIAGEYFNIRVPLTGEYKIGQNWKDCH